tara:strand:- start:624 stop:953 length:330 start_codon:yes stop_codon:yes gene_type:complete
MAKLLETRLPIAGSEITPDVFNRLVRVLELNLQKFDPNGTLQITTAQKLGTKFNLGDIIFDTNKNTLEFFNGKEFEVLSAQPTLSLEATASLGEVTVSEEGVIDIKVNL